MRTFNIKTRPNKPREDAEKRLALFIGAVVMIFTLPLGPVGMTLSGMVTYVVARLYIGSKIK